MPCTFDRLFRASQWYGTVALGYLLDRRIAPPRPEVANGVSVIAVTASLELLGTVPFVGGCRPSDQIPNISDENGQNSQIHGNTGGRDRPVEYRQSQ